MYDKAKIRKLLIVCGGMVVLIVAAILLIFVVNRNSIGMAELKILVAPTIARIEVDGKEYKNGTHKMAPGEVKIMVSCDGFETEEKSIVLTAGQMTEFYTYLIPLDGDYSWYSKNEDNEMLLNTIGDAMATSESKKYSEMNPIIRDLPIIYANYDEKWNYTEFRIDGGVFEDCTRAFCVKITDTTGGNYDHALKLIKEKGYNPEDYEILYEYKPIQPLK